MATKKTDAPAETASIAQTDGLIVQSATTPPPSPVTDEGEQAKAITVAQAQITAGDQADAQEAIDASGAPAELQQSLESQARQVPQSEAAVQRDVADGLAQLGRIVKRVVPGGVDTMGERASAADIQRQTLEAFGLAAAPAGQGEADAAAKPVETTPSPEGQPAQQPSAATATAAAPATKASAPAVAAPAAQPAPKPAA